MLESRRVIVATIALVLVCVVATSAQPVLSGGRGPATGPMVPSPPGTIVQSVFLYFGGAAANARAVLRSRCPDVLPN